MSGNLLVGLSEIIVVGVAAQWIAWRFKFPSILLLLLFGFILGPLTHLLDPDWLFGELLLPFVSLSVAVVLFEGGLSLSLSQLGKNLNIVRNLVTVGVLVTWLLGALAAYLFTGLGVALSLLVGAIFVVSGPTVIIPLLRYVRPQGQISAIVKWEGIINDPVGAVLAVLVFEAITAGGAQSAFTVVMLGIARTLIIGGGLGAVFGWLLTKPLRRYWIPDFLQNSVVLMAVILAFTISNLLQDDAGLVTVTAMGVYLSNQKNLAIRPIIEFKENLRVLLISGLFIVLAARLDLAAIQQLNWGSLVFVAVLIIIVRPVAVLISTFRSGLSWQEKTFLAFMAPRGIVAAAVSAVFALELHEAGYPQAEVLVPLTFLVIISTVSVYGLAGAPLGKWLKVAHPDPQGVLIVGAHSWARKIGVILKEANFRVLIVDTNPNNIHRANQQGLDTAQANIVAEPDVSKLELGGIGRLLALTPNDEINSLAALHFIETFSRSDVYQLALTGPDGHPFENNQQAVATTLRGRCVFHKKATFHYLDQAFKAGAELKTIALTQTYSWQDFLEEYGERAIPMCLFTDNELHFITTDAPTSARAGQTLISLILPETV